MTKPQIRRLERFLAKHPEPKRFYGWCTLYKPHPTYGDHIRLKQSPFRLQYWNGNQDLTVELAPGSEEFRSFFRKWVQRINLSVDTYEVTSGYRHYNGTVYF